jgi:hypothetical protein
VPTRNIIYGFNAAGFVILDKYSQPNSYCFDDLGVEPIGCHYTKECNVMGEILLSRYDLSLRHPELDSGSHQKKFLTKTHITTHLNAQELENKYGNRVRSRMRQMMNVIAFDSNSVDKRL